MLVRPWRPALFSLFLLSCGGPPTVVGDAVPPERDAAGGPELGPGDPADAGSLIDVPAATADAAMDAPAADGVSATSGDAPGSGDVRTTTDTAEVGGQTR